MENILLDKKKRYVKIVGESVDCAKCAMSLNRMIIFPLP